MPHVRRHVQSTDYAGPDRRNGLGNGNGNEWKSLTAWANAMRIVGIPGAIAIFLVYVGATEVPKLATAINVAITEIRLVHELFREHVDQTTHLIHIAERACRNAAKAAKDDYARDHCGDE